MAEISTLAAVAGLAGAGLSAAGSLSAGKAAEQQANYQAAVLRQQAERERRIAEIEARRIRKDGERLAARQRARVAAAGARLTGTPLLLIGQTAEDAELGALTALNNAEAAAIRKQQEAELERASGRTKRRAGQIRAGSTLLGGVARYGPDLKP